MSNPTGSIIELFRDCRMVLDVPCGEGELLKHLTELRVPCIGIDPDPELVAKCREAKLIAWACFWQVIAGHREKFDGIRVSVDAFPDGAWRHEFATMLLTLADGLLPRGVLVISGADDLQELISACRPNALEISGHQDGAVILVKKAPQRSSTPSPGMIVGPYADAFVGCERVLEIGCGRGHFLDALAVRDIGCWGIEEDDGLAEESRARGHQIECGTVSMLVDRQADSDGIYLGNIAERLRGGDLETLLALCLHSLRPGGRMLVRTAAQPHDPASLAGLCNGLGFSRVRTTAVPGDRDDYSLFAIRGDHAGPSVTARLARAAELRICTGEDRINQPLQSLHDLERFEAKTSSQGGEDGVIQAIFDHIGVTNRYYVEFGCGDGVQCNTAQLRRHGWQGLLMDGVAQPDTNNAVIHREWISADNINDLFGKHGVPDEFDLLSIDIDGNDYWVWDAIRYRPRVVVVEYNANLAVDQSLTIPYSAEHQWDGSDHYGASLLALARLGKKKAYTLVYCNQAGVNAFFVHDSFARGLTERSLEDIYRRPNYWYRGYRQRPNLEKHMIEV